MYIPGGQVPQEGKSVISRALRGLGDGLGDIVDDIQFGVDSTQSVTPVVPDTSSSGSSFSDVLNSITGAITGATNAAVQVYSAVDLIKVNQQRASMGYPPLNQYGQVVSSTTSGSFGMPSWLWLAILGGGAFVLLKRK
jgi:hypothetical protein